jgi:hypothetical protein
MRIPLVSPGLTESYGAGGQFVESAEQFFSCRGIAVPVRQ